MLPSILANKKDGGNVRKKDTACVDMPTASEERAQPSDHNEEPVFANWLEEELAASLEAELGKILLDGGKVVEELDDAVSALALLEGSFEVEPHVMNAATSASSSSGPDAPTLVAHVHQPPVLHVHQPMGFQTPAL